MLRLAYALVVAVAVIFACFPDCVNASQATQLTDDTALLASLDSSFVFQAPTNLQFIDPTFSAAMPFSNPPFPYARPVATGVTPIVFPFANEANNQRQCPWITGAPVSNKCGGSLLCPRESQGKYPSRWIGGILEFQDDAPNQQGRMYKALLSDSSCKCPTAGGCPCPGMKKGSPCSAPKCPARDAIVAAINEFAFRSVFAITGSAPVVSMNRCGFPDPTFGCASPDKIAPHRMNPQITLGYAAATGRFRLIVQFAVDWNTIKALSGGKITSFGPNGSMCPIRGTVSSCLTGDKSYVCAVLNFFKTRTTDVATIWQSSILASGAGSSQFLGLWTGARRLNEAGEEEVPSAEEEGTERKLPVAVKKAPPKVKGVGTIAVMSSGSGK